MRDKAKEVENKLAFESLSRRSLMLSLAGVALAACGGGGGGGSGGSASSSSSSSSSSSKVGFTHPGLLHSQADFVRMAQKVRDKVSPWIEGWNVLTANGHASLGYKARPVAEVYRGNDSIHVQNYSLLYNDVAAAYACALRWKVSGDAAYADKAIEIMNAWSATMTFLGTTDGTGGTYDGILLAGLQGYQFANAGEIMRDYSGWRADDFAHFQTLMKTIFYPINVGALHIPDGSSLTVNSNWDLCCVASIMAIGVLCDDESIFNTAVDFFINGASNGAIAQTVYYMHPGYLGQTQEAGRDQGHNTLSVGLMAAICEMAWNQDVDLYGYDNNRFLAAAEYTAKGNLIESGSSYYSVPFAPYRNRNTSNTVFSTGAQGNVRPIWAMIANHYIGRKGIAAPYVSKIAATVQPEGGGGNYGPNSGGYDQLGYGTLAHTRDAGPAASAPSGLTAVTSAGAIVLSWWGVAGASSYTVKRGTRQSGPFTVIASNITDLLSYTDAPALSGAYYYVVTALLAGAETRASNVARAFVGQQLHTHLRFDELSGAAASDASGNGHGASLSAGCGWTSGRSGSAISFDGSTGFVSLPEKIFADLSDFTIAAWVYWNGGSAWQRVFDFGNGITQYMMLTPKSGNAGAAFRISVNGNYGEMALNAPSPLPTGVWTHVAVTLSGRMGTLYVNGAAVATNAEMWLSPMQLSHPTRNWLGRSQYSVDPYFNGKIDDFRIYYGALSPSEISAL